MTKIIEVDMDVYKALESLRETFLQSHNDILRRVLKIVEAPQPSPHTTPTFDIKVDRSRKLQLNYNMQEPDITEIMADYNNTTPNTNLYHESTWSFGGVRLPAGTPLRKWWRKKKYEAIIKDGSIVINGEHHLSPSAAAMAINGGINVNGWRFWEYYDFQTQQWLLLDTLRNRQLHAQHT